jgi:hypothetical protein
LPGQHIGLMQSAELNRPLHREGRPEQGSESAGNPTRCWSLCSHLSPSLNKPLRGNLQKSRRPLPLTEANSYVLLVLDTLVAPYDTLGREQVTAFAYSWRHRGYFLEQESASEAGTSAFQQQRNSAAPDHSVETSELARPRVQQTQMPSVVAPN